MTYLMPDGRCISGPPLSAANPSPAMKPARKSPYPVEAKAPAAAKGGRK